MRRGFGVVGSLGVAAVVGLALERGAVHRSTACGAADEAGEHILALDGARLATTGPAGVLDAVVAAVPELAVDERRPCRLVGHDPLVLHLPVLPARRARGRVTRVEQLVLPALATDDLVAEVARVRENRAHH